MSFIDWNGLLISTRTANCLKNAGIETIDVLVSMTQSDLLRVDNFGRKSLNEIVEQLRFRGMSLTRHPLDPRSTPEGEDLYHNYELAKLEWEVYVEKFKINEMSRRLREMK